MALSTLIQNQTYLYHLTCIDNLASIFSTGLRSRSSLGKEFVDVADGQIIEGREAQTLETMVPFHFFANNPFDGRVKTDHKDKVFCLIAVQRTFAKANNWKIIPQHPLASAGLRLMEYDEGFATIDWDVMNQRNYKDAVCKSVCMAECLSPITVEVKDFSSFYVKDEKSKKEVERLLKKANLSKFVNINPAMC